MNSMKDGRTGDNCSLNESLNVCEFILLGCWKVQKRNVDFKYDNTLFTVVFPILIN